MAPNRSRSNSNAYQHNNNRSRSPNVSRHAHRQHNSNHAAHPMPNVFHAKQDQHRPKTPLTQQPVPQESRMSPASRYNYNLRVLRRRDPTIASIFDQFSHVCLYQHDGEKWEKKGYEGSMFLFERSKEPKYGFFILNRMGMDDYIQNLLPEDDMNQLESILVYQCLKPYRKRTYDSDEEDEPEGPEVLGLWTMTTDAREPMGNVMLRLISYVKKGLPYPQQFRYGPDRHPPLSISSQAQFVQKDSDLDEDENQAPVLENGHSQISNVSKTQRQPHPNTSSPPSNEVNSIDQLFAKLGPTPSNSSNSGTVRLTSPSATTAGSILGMLRAGPPSKQQQVPQTTEPPRGITLLETILASAAKPSPGPAQLVANSQPQQQDTTLESFIQSVRNYTGDTPDYAPRRPQSQAQALAQFQFPAPGQRPMHADTSALEIHSPKPSTGTLPQILNSQVLSELMGLPKSASSTTSSKQAQPRTPSRGSQSTSSVPGGMHENSLDSYSPSSAKGTRGSTERGYIADRGEDDGGLSEASTGAEVELSRGNIALSSSFSNISSVGGPAPRGLVARSSFLSAAGTASSQGSQKGDATPRARHGNGLESTPSASRIPFQADSELWPHGLTHGTPGAAETTSTQSNTSSISALGQNVGDVGDNDVLVELDFSEINVLDDTPAFEAKGTRRGRDRAPNAKSVVSANGSSASTANGATKTRRLKRDKEKEKKVPNVQSPDGTSTAANTVTPSVTSPARSSAPSTTNGPTSVSSDLAKELILREALGRNSNNKDSTGNLSRNEFMSQILTLIHTDKSFVDSLYRGYLNAA